SCRSCGVRPRRRSSSRTAAWAGSGPAACRHLPVGSGCPETPPADAEHVDRRDGTVRLAGKVALISGGARGMGAVEARLFACEGAKVVLGDVLEAEAREVAGEIGKSGGEALSVALDVTRETDWTRAVEMAATRFGKLDILV